LAYLPEIVVAIGDFFSPRQLKQSRKILTMKQVYVIKRNFLVIAAIYFDLCFISNAVSTVYRAHNQHVVSFLPMSCSMYKYNYCDVVIISKRKLYLLESMVSMFSYLWWWYSREVKDLYLSKTSKWGKGLCVTGPCCRNTEL